jgi:hypothetical protein
MTSPTAAAKLVSRFADFRGRLSTEELQNWHLMLSAMVGEMADQHRPPASASAARSWRMMVGAICETYPGGARRLGRLGPLNAALTELAAEAVELTDSQIRLGDATSGTVESGVLATNVAHDPRLQGELIRQAGVPLGPPASVSYFYYHRPGDFLLPHADPIVSSGVICLTTLVHTPRSDGGRPSALVVYGPDGAGERFELAPGESVMMLGGGTVHAREPIGPGETVINLSVGFPFRDVHPAAIWDRSAVAESPS